MATFHERLLALSEKRTFLKEYLPTATEEECLAAFLRETAEYEEPGRREHLVRCYFNDFIECCCESSYHTSDRIPFDELYSKLCQMCEFPVSIRHFRTFVRVRGGNHFCRRDKMDVWQCMKFKWSLRHMADDTKACFGLL